MRLRTSDTAFWIEVDGIELLVSPRPAAEQDDLRKKCTTIQFKRGMRNEETDSAAYSRRLFIATVRDWRNAVDEHGNPLPCDDKTKGVVADHNARWVQDVLDRADRGEQVLKADALGNSETTPTDT